MLGFLVSTLISIIGATGESFLFASFFLALAEVLKCTGDNSVAILREYTFVFVFSSAFTVTFTSQKLLWRGKRNWIVSLFGFLVFFLLAYAFNLWPEKPALLPDFTVRAFLWYGGALSLCLLNCYLCHWLLGDEQFKGQVEKVLYIRKWTFCLATAVYAAPVVMAVFSGGILTIPYYLLIFPGATLLATAVAIGWQLRNESLSNSFYALLVVWLSFGLSWLSLPIVLLLDKLLSSLTVTMFDIQVVHFSLCLLGILILNIVSIFVLYVARRLANLI